ncbi:hypothetical protein BC831DRAFT_461378 [Entophlyctis helioformis]|nr:hypothetical protein BC831DRAFT_461378 [Entophlyctis helioformis]
MAAKVLLDDYRKFPYLAIGPLFSAVASLGGIYGMFVFSRRILDRIMTSKPLKAMLFALLGLNALAIVFQVAESIHVHSDVFQWPLIFRNWTYALSNLCLHMMQIEILVTFNRGLNIVKWLKDHNIGRLRLAALLFHFTSNGPLYLEEIAISYYNPQKGWGTISSGLFTIYAGAFGVTTNILILRSLKDNLKITSNGTPNRIKRSSSSNQSGNKPKTLRMAEMGKDADSGFSKKVPSPGTDIPLRRPSKGSTFRSLASIRTQSSFYVQIDLKTWMCILLALDATAAVIFVPYIIVKAPPGTLVYKLIYVMQQVLIGTVGVHMVAESIVFDSIARMFSNAISKPRGLDNNQIGGTSSTSATGSAVGAIGSAAI